MNTMVAGLVLLAAVLHSTWNAIAKDIPSRLASSTLIGLAYLIAGGVGIVFLPMPPVASWPFILISACLQTAYLILLTASYKHGDFGQVYPLARGFAVLLVAIVATVFLGEHLTPVQLVGVAVVAGSLLALVLIGPRSANTKGVFLAMLTGISIAAYSLVDGVGVRYANAPDYDGTLSYAAVLFALQGVMVPMVSYALAPHKRAYLGQVRTHWRLGLLGGTLSLLAYTIVLWAQSIAPLALVSALRETSVLLAGVIGFLFFKERFSSLRMVLTATAVAGIIALQSG